MAETHEPHCDGNHTDRQACNRTLEQMPVTSEATASEELVAEDAAEQVIVLEAPGVLIEEAATFGPVARAVRQPAAEGDVETSSAALPAERIQMPAPSAWAVRAWEDTAAAVGATASAARPPGTPTGETDANDDGASQGIAGHMPLLVGLASAAALAIFIARRRRL